MARASEYWDKLYANAEAGPGEAPSRFLESVLPRLSKGKALDVGMGRGENAVFLAEQGFEVKGFDVSQVAIDFAKNLALKKGVAIDTSKVDLDLFIFGLMEYDTITMMNFRPPIERYYSELIRALKQGGTLIVDSLTIEEMPDAIPADEAYRNYYYRPNELLKALSPLRILFYHEGRIDGHYRVQCLAKKPSDKDAAKYDMFNIQSKKEEKVIDRQRELAEQLFKKK